MQHGERAEVRFAARVGKFQRFRQEFLRRARIVLTHRQHGEIVENVYGLMRDIRRARNRQRAREFVFGDFVFPAFERDLSEIAQDARTAPRVFDFFIQRVTCPKKFFARGKVAAPPFRRAEKKQRIRAFVCVIFQKRQPAFRQFDCFGKFAQPKTHPSFAAEQLPQDVRGLGRRGAHCFHTRAGAFIQLRAE
ncbi:MAG: hypothetical protein HDKAJFGB_00698 [Anaerolineae bacterium]|nr:hypothetical protein [Anaerolineae bacterium]